MDQLRRVNPFAKQEPRSQTNRDTLVNIAFITWALVLLSGLVLTAFAPPDRAYVGRKIWAQVRILPYSLTLTREWKY